MKAKAHIQLPIQSENQLKSLLQALAPEVKRPVGVRAKATIRAEAKTLFLTVKAEDTVALRAALNTYLRWINSALNVLKIVDQTTQ